MLSLLAGVSTNVRGRHKVIDFETFGKCGLDVNE
jgi:hypothetical protein